MVKVEDMIENLTGYLESRIELLKIDAKNEGTKIGVNVVVGIIVGVFGFFTMVCLTIALGLWLGDLVNSRPAGFLLAAAAFLILTTILLLSKNALLKLVQKRVFPKYQNPS